QAAAVRTQAKTVRFNGRGQNGGAYSDLIVRLREKETGRGAFTPREAVDAPGTQPLDFRYRDSAKLIRGGQPIRLEVHYTPNGKVTSDQTKVPFPPNKMRIRAGESACATPLHHDGARASCGFKEAHPCRRSQLGDQGGTDIHSGC